MHDTTGLTPRKTRILMVDDHPIVREGMALFLNAQPDLNLCFQAANAAQALALAADHALDLVIVDLSLAKESGLDLIKTLRRRDPDIALLVLSLHDESVFAERALQAGANGYLMKQEATSSILLAIRTVLAGEVYLSAAMHQRLSRTIAEPDPRSISPIAGLSAREFEVLHLIGLGFGSRQISAKLNRSIKTIETHRAHLKGKLKLQSSGDLLRFAVRWLDDGVAQAD